MGRLSFCLPLAFLFLGSVIPAFAQKTEAGAAAGAGTEETRVTVSAGAPLTVECRLRPEQRAEWQRDGAAPPPDLRAAPEAAADARLAARLRAPAARPHHAGLYTCTRERDHRVRVVVLPAAAHAPAGEAAVSGKAVAEASASAVPLDAGVAEVAYDVRSNFTLHCQLPNDNNLEYVWKKNDTSVENVLELKDRYVLDRGNSEFRVARSVEDDFGNYSCSLAGQDAEQRWAVRGRPHIKLPANTNVVEGQKLKITCKVIGKPYPRVSWDYKNSSDAEYADVVSVLGERVVLSASEQGVPDGALTLAAAERADAGDFRCRVGTASDETTLRVKDMYAALWPFLGICAEVFVLCAIILVYEKRRTKPEMEDSDADNDQKKS